jgi:(E)-2-((N-methylformamido)methylene)succinate hydrolase
MAPPDLMRAPDGTAFDIHGPLDAPAVVLIHGLGLNRAVWDLTQPALAPRYRVLRYDILGHDQTPGPIERPSLPLLTRQLAALMDYLHLPAAALVGFSLGGMIARHFAQSHPDRVTALALLHSPHLRASQAQEAIAARVVQARAQGPAATVEAALVRWFSDDFRAANPAMMDLVRSWVLANNPATYPDYYRILVEEVADVVAPDPPLTCPTLVVTGDEDYGNGPEMTHAIAAEIPGARTLILKGLRHMALMEDPAALNTPLRAFLDALPRP